MQWMRNLNCWPPTEVFSIRRARKLAEAFSTGLYRRALLLGVAAGTENARLLSALVPSPVTIIDIGANRGQFALVARKCCPAATVVSFEPLAEAAAIFRRVFDADPLTILHQIAIGPLESEASMHVSRADDSSSLLPISELQSQLFPGTAEKERRAIRVRPLDAVLKPIDIGTPALLKLDVQGFELEALKGCASLLPRFAYVYVECSFVELYSGQALAHQIISYLGGFQFLLDGIYNITYEKRGRAIQGDFLFASSSGAAP